MRDDYNLGMTSVEIQMTKEIRSFKMTNRFHTFDTTRPVGRCSMFVSLRGLLCTGWLVSFAVATALSADPKQPLWPAEGIEDFTLTECHGQTVTKADLLGKPWLACFIFTHCLGPCPLVSEQMEILQDRLKGLDIRLVSITVDPDRDTPDVLKAYAERHHADPERWWFLTGDKAEIFRLIRRSFRMIVAEEPNPEPGFEIMHSITIMHVSAEGRVLAQYNARNNVDMARLRRVLLGAADANDSKLIEKADEEEREREAEQRRLQAEAEGRAAPAWVLRLPTVNAALNGLATVLLLAGFGLIKSGRSEAHKTVMLSAFVTSILFLGFYLLYHFALWHFTGESSRKFTGTGAIRPVYLTILVTHVLLAMSVPVLAGITIYRGLTAQWERHKRIARITFPIWLYVSVTGVIIYGMLYHWPPAG
jgi:protein SCO1/2/putative membrane protein